jgi:hypothetical protein
VGKYTGDKWGGKYLRAPDIYWTILEKGKGKLVRLGDIAEVRFGIKTGANDFFYLEPTGKPAPNGLLHVRNGAGWEGEVEEEFLKPFLFSLKEIAEYQVDPAALKRRAFVCSRTKRDLTTAGSRRALEYIAWGEEAGYHRRPSVQGRPAWHTLPDQPTTHFVSNRFLGERFGFPWAEGILVCDVFFVGKFRYAHGLVGTALLNSAASFLSAEILARKAYGIGVAYLYGPEVSAIYVLDPKVIPQPSADGAVTAFARMRQRRILKLKEEFRQPDRRALDDIIFDILGLTPGEREAVYEAVIDLVEARLKKAKSV